MNLRQKVLILLIINLFAGSVLAEEIKMDDKVVVFETNQGLIEIKLFPEIAPKASQNFIGLV